MHVADSVLNYSVCAAAGAVSAAAVGYSVHRLRDQLGTRTIPLTGMMSALIFAGQMVNFPLIGLPVSGHLMGGVLASMILGPFAGLVSISLVLIMQCLLFADGGLLALGVNILHMGVLGAWGGYGVARLVAKKFRNQQTGLVIGAIVGSWLSVVAASALFTLEFWYSWRTYDFNFGRILTLMVLFHSVIGIGEALITAGVLKQMLSVRPDLVAAWHPENANTPRSDSWGRFVAAGSIVALAIAAFVAPFASAHPDGLEAVAERTAFEELAEPTRVALLEDYEVPAPVAAWSESGWWEKVSVSLAGIGGTLAILGLCWIFTRKTPVAIDRSGATL